MTELAAAFLQAAITAGVAVVWYYVYRRYRKPYFRVWAVAWTLYAVRLGAIIVFLVSEQEFWLFAHQVLTGWTAVAFLWAAVSFSRPVPWRSAYLVLVGFPLVWSYIAIYRLDEFLLAAGPAVAFLAGATAWTGLVFWRYHRRVGSRASALIAVGFVLWSLHHLDYPFLRARGAWNPWGYYIDILFALAIGFGILLLVLEDLQRGLSVLSGLSRELQAEGSEDELLEALLTRTLALPGVDGSAIYDLEGERFERGSGMCAPWAGEPAEGAVRQALLRMAATGLPESVPDSGPGFLLVLPVFRSGRPAAGLVVAGGARHPFAALDDRFLVALGHQVGGALANARLRSGLERRQGELEQLAARMVRQQEDERRRLHRELHDESAQVFAALKLQLGMLREGRFDERDEAIDRAEELVGEGIRSIRAAASELRPVLLDDLGLVTALQGLVAAFREQSGLEVALKLDEPPPLPDDVELAFYRSLQEGLSNVARHASEAESVSVRLTVGDDVVELEVRDDGAAWDDSWSPAGGTGLIGMRERFAPSGGTVDLARDREGTRLRVRVPLVAVDR